MAHILLAEDDVSMRTFLEAALIRSGHVVTACGDGHEALAAIENNPGIDLLLADIVMPGMDGIELSQAAARLVPGLKIMFITGFMAVASSRFPEGEPQPQVLAKPFHLSQLVDQVEKLLASGQAA